MKVEVRAPMLRRPAKTAHALDLDVHLQIAAAPPDGYRTLGVALLRFVEHLPDSVTFRPPQAFDGHVFLKYKSDSAPSGVVLLGRGKDNAV